MADQQAMRSNGQPFRGVFFREHPTRLHGINPDRYFFLKFWGRGRTLTEGVGWASEGVKPTDAHKRLIEIKAALRAGTYQTPVERKASEDAKRAAEAEAKALAEKADVTVGRFFHGDYLKAQAGKKAESIRRERDFFDLFIGPEIGAKTFAEVAPFDVERIKAKMTKADRSPRTVQYCLAVIRQIFNTARFQGLHDRESPTLRVKKPRFDNRRTRHLTEAEAGALLAKLKAKSAKTYQQTVLSLYAGLRFGEIASLTWGDVDLDRGLLTLRDTKSGKTRVAFITEKIRAEVFDVLTPGKPDDLVFPDRNGGRMIQVSAVFLRTVKELGLNDGITDPRLKVCFHTCRHTFASWLVERGTDLFQVSKLLGHSTIALTERYSHLRPDTLQAAVKVLDKAPSATVVNLAEAAEGEK
jgi:integrase